MERITISASLKYKESIRNAIGKLKEVGVVALFPNLDIGVAKEDVTVDLLKRIIREHFDAIDKSEALYVICPQGYVGTLVSVEIGYAYASGKPVIFSEEPEDLGLQALASLYLSLEELHGIKELYTDRK